MIDSKQIHYEQLVLVVDDQEINRDILGSILEDKYRLIYAENGQEAMALIREHTQDLALVLLDLMMPVMNGFEVLEQVKGDEELKRIPVIVLTADQSAELQALQMGAADFITKPVEIHEIVQTRVDRIIELSDGRQLISAAEYDKLTMLYHRNFFFEYCRRLFQHHSEIHMDAVALNIEQFHSVNALHGRDFGDHVLKAIGEEIEVFLTKTQGIASRIEADRFAIYCAHQDDYASLLDRFQERVNAVSKKVNIHLRMGVKPWTEGEEPVMMFDQARAACSLARGNYQNPLKIYDEKMRERELMNQRLLNDLRSAVEERQFLVCYQPKYNVQCDPPRLSSAEALVRWRHPELGMVSPEEFIPLFENNGLIGVVDEYVWKETVCQIAAWKEKYHFTLPVSVNLSRSEMTDPDLEERLVQLVKSKGLDFSSLKLEVTESAYTDNMKQILETVHHLRDHGFEIEMDDFGSGYSSLNMLSDMPIDGLKMDMKFVRNIENSETDRRLLALVLDIARYLNVPAVAEGVETVGQLKILQENGCDLVQGFYFSGPLSPEEFELLIQRELEIERSKEA